VQGRGFIIYISISAAWAHVELAMLLKNVKLRLAGVYLALVKFLWRICCHGESGTGKCLNSGMGPYGAHHAPKTC